MAKEKSIYFWIFNKIFTNFSFTTLLGEQGERKSDARCWDGFGLKEIEDESVRCYV